MPEHSLYIPPERACESHKIQRLRLPPQKYTPATHFFRSSLLLARSRAAILGGWKEEPNGSVTGSASACQRTFFFGALCLRAGFSAFEECKGDRI